MAGLKRMSCPGDEEYSSWLELLDIQASSALLDSLGDFLADYLASTGLRLYVLGLSGGIDSSFLAALLHQRQIPYLGFCLPISSNTPAEIQRGTQVAETYATPMGLSLGCVHDFTSVYDGISASFRHIAGQAIPVAEGNIKARIRMIFLYHMAQLHGGCVLSTDQLDELLTGFWTLHGDVGDVSPLQLIPKSVEYELAAMLCERLTNPAPLQAAIEAVPTDGLGISASDLEQLEVESYLQVEELFRQYFRLRQKEATLGLTPGERLERSALEKTGPIRRFLQSGFKRSGAVLVDPRSVGT